MASAFAIQIEVHLGVSYVYAIFGGVCILIAVFLIFSLKDVKESRKTKVEESERELLAEAEAEDVYPKETDRLSSRAETLSTVSSGNPTFKLIFKQLLHHTWAQKTCIVAFISIWATLALEMAALQYG